jgi:hypothetical protein
MPPRQRLILLLLLPLSGLAMYLLGSLAPARADGANPMDAWMVLAGSAPVFAAVAFAWRSEKLLLDFFQPELIGLYAWWISLINGYIAAAAAPFIGLLPKPDAGPAAAARLDLPVNYLALALIAGVAVFFVWFLFRPGGLGAQADRIYMPQRRSTLLMALALLVIVVFLLGGTSLGYALLPSVWLWIFIIPRTGQAGKLFNGALALGGLARPLALGAQALGQGAWWRLVLAAAYGRLTALEVFLFLFWMALFARFFRLAFSRPYVAPAAPDDPLLALLKSR